MPGYQLVPGIGPVELGYVVPPNDDMAPTGDMRVIMPEPKPSELLGFAPPNPYNPRLQPSCTVTPTARMSARALLREARAELRRIDTEIRRLEGLKRDRAQLAQLIAAAKSKPLAPVRAIRGTG